MCLYVDYNTLRLVGCVCVLTGSEVEEKVMSVLRERIPLAATQPLTDSRYICSSYVLPALPHSHGMCT